MKIYMVSLLHRATIKKIEDRRKKLKGKNIMAPLLHRAAIRNHRMKIYYVRILVCKAAINKQFFLYITIYSGVMTELSVFHNM